MSLLESLIADVNKCTYSLMKSYQMIPVAARSKAWVCGRSLARITGSNPAEGMYICLS